MYREIIVQTKMNWLSRIEMLSLYPKRWIHGAVSERIEYINFCAWCPKVHDMLFESASALIVLKFMAAFADNFGGG